MSVELAPNYVAPMEWSHDGSHLRLTTPEARKKASRQNMSASTMKGVDGGCAASWAANSVLPRKSDPFSPMDIGNGAHRVMELLMEREGPARTVAVARRIATEVSKAKFPDGPETERKEWRKEILSRVEPLWDIEDPKDVNVLATEEQYRRVEVEGVPIWAYIDRTDRTDEGDRVIDYKTGRPSTEKDARRWLEQYGSPDDEGDQIRLYAIIYKIRHGVYPVKGLLYYTKDGSVREVSLDKKLIKETLARYLRAWEKLNSHMETGEYPTKVSALCGWCPLVATCPAAAAEGKVSRKDDNPTAEQLPIPVAPKVPAAHLTGKKRKPKKAKKEKAAMIKGYTKVEGRPFDDAPGDKLDPNSYAATGVFGMMELALNTLADNDQPLRARNVRSFSQTLAYIVMTAQQAAFGAQDWSLGSNTRVRGALRTSLEVAPPPFGDDLDSWDTWVDSTIKRIINIAKTALDIYQGDPSRGAWEHLAQD